MARFFVCVHSAALGRQSLVVALLLPGLDMNDKRVRVWPKSFATLLRWRGVVVVRRSSVRACAAAEWVCMLGAQNMTIHWGTEVMRPAACVWVCV